MILVVAGARTSGAQSVAEFLDQAGRGPAGLVIEGEAGIGKTTVWLEAVDKATSMEFVVLSARGASAEVSLTFAALAELLRDVDDDVFDNLPEVQRVALDRVLLRGAEGPATDERVVGAAFLSVLDALAAEAPVLVAIDDAHWLDTATRSVVAFVARRLKGRVGILATARTGESDASDRLSWLQLPRPSMLTRLTVQPLSLGGLHLLVNTRLGCTLPRPTMTRIHDLSGGNPYYAIELAQASIDSGSPVTELPDSLAALMRQRIGVLDSDVATALQTAAATVAPTTDLVASALETTPKRIVDLLERVEIKGIISIDGNRIKFAHPLLASGVSSNTTAAEQRLVHRKLAAVVEQPELKARHLALACAHGDADALQALDTAAAVTRGRGAPASAAELVDIAIGLGGDTPYRRMVSAENHFQAGDVTRARAVLEPAMSQLPPGVLHAAACALLAGICTYTDGFAEATVHLRTGLSEVGDIRALRVQMELMLAFTHTNLANFDVAMQHLAAAQADAELLGVDAVTSQVLSMSAMLNCIRGNGIDPKVRQRALDLEDLSTLVPIVFQASVNEAQLLAWEGRLDAAREQFGRVWARSSERGAETELLFLAVQSVLVAIWRGDLTEADSLARDAMMRAEQLGGDNSLLIALTVKIAVAAYTGQVEDVRTFAEVALEIAQRREMSRTLEWIATIQGFVEVSRGRHAAAVTILQPLIDWFATVNVGTEIMNAGFMPDAVEALVAVGRLDDAEPLVAALESDGARLDRPWIRAVGARARAMLVAAQGNLAEAERLARCALVEHDRVPMPFERARTQLLLGKLQRRRRQKQAATATLSAARDEFERIGTTLWVQRAADELARMAPQRADGAGLTPAEQRIADRAAVGMSNKEIAAELFIAPKTVEMALTSVYRKLGIRSRAQLAARLHP